MDFLGDLSKTLIPKTGKIERKNRAEKDKL